MLIRLLDNQGRAALTVLPALNCCLLTTHLYRYFDFWHSRTRYFHRNRVVFGISGSFLHITEPLRHVAEPSRQVAKPFSQVAKPFRQVAKSFRQVAKSFRQVAKSFRQVAKPFRQVAKSFRQVAKSFRQVAKSFRQVAKSFRQVEKSFRQVEMSFRRVAKWLHHMTLTFKGRLESLKRAGDPSPKVLAGGFRCIRFSFSPTSSNRPGPEVPAASPSSKVNRSSRPGWTARSRAHCCPAR
jgi:hypothetical protein